jgi:hypothetical protein
MIEGHAHLNEVKEVDRITAANTESFFAPIPMLFYLPAATL